MTEENNELSSRRLLKRLRAIMSSDEAEQAQLDAIVEAVADEMHVDVCSFYCLLPGDILELYASFGLHASAVHETRLRLGEGLIGEIAIQKKSQAFADAWNHPSFVFKPETQEDPFSSLMGVPVLRGTRLIGVLSVQTREYHDYTEDEIELLETVAMVLAQMFVTEHTSGRRKNLSAIESNSRLDGLRLVPGVALGKVFLHKRTEPVAQIVSKNDALEIRRLDMALEQMSKAVNEMLAQPDLIGENEEIFDTYRMFIHDKGWIAKIKESIHAGLTASAAVQKVADEISARMNVISDPYLKERVHDFQDLADRLQQYLAGRDVKEKNKQLPNATILVARSMGPAELLDYDRSKIKALLFEEGSPTMHVVIVAKSLNIPVIGGLQGLLDRVHQGDTVAVDSDNSCIYVNPPADLLSSVRKKIDTAERLRKQYGKLANVPCQTKDGVAVSLNVNAGLATDLLSLSEGFADGIGLYRTELPFLSAAQLPDVSKQERIYRRALSNAKGKKVIFRTLDIGSDKVLPYVQRKAETNPAMGWRSVRISLDRRSLLRGQLRAFIYAVGGGDLYVMFPMIADVDEFIAAKKTLEIELQREKEKGRKLPAHVYVGTMLEVPSLLFQLEELLPLVDFISIGTNDLVQFLFAIDRSDASLWDRYDSLSPALIRVLKHVADRCAYYKVPCSVCGEMANQPLDAMVLVALGYTSLSMNAAALGRVKAMILSMNAQEVAEYLNFILSTRKHSLREQLRHFACDHQIVI